MIEAVLYQSLLDAKSRRSVQQLSNLKFDGLSTARDGENTDNGVLYGTFVQSGSNYVLTLYSDATKVDLVASGSVTAPGLMKINEQNGSGINGSVSIVQYVADDNQIKAVCLLSTDKDLPMNNLEALSDYDEDKGFVWFHERAFEKVKEFIQTRYSSQLWNPDLVDVSQINGGRGGWDYSRLLNWSAFRDASRYYALALISEKQDVEEGTFSRRAKQSREIYKGYCTTTEAQFDTDGDRVANRTRSLSAWKFSRA